MVKDANPTAPDNSLNEDDSLEFSAERYQVTQHLFENIILTTLDDLYNNESFQEQRNF